ncbi:MAG: flagellar biosynthesis protein FlhB [Alphaproteobacteria bacterium]|nr:flagellar biosynthesis protein FlhB [Alphaproteobacteria bacterium]
MADEDDSQKTEEPSERKLTKARSKGQVSSSQEVKSWSVLFGGAMSLAILAPWMMERVTLYIVGFIENAHAVTLTVDVLPLVLSDVLLETGITLAPFFGVLVLLAIVANLSQTGLIVAPSKLKPDFGKISPLKGLKRMFSLRSVVEFLKGVIKLTVLGTVAFGMAIPLMSDIELIADFDVMSVLDRLYVVAIAIFTGAIIVMTVVAILDFIYQKFDFMKSMRMSRQELKDEHKDTEGDPQIKARIRRLRAERAQQRMMAAVPKADVVITNPTHFAVALEYKMQEMSAPRLVAKGVDSLAFRIREVAEENKVPIVENPPLARALYASVELDEEIPVEHYQAVAEVIGYVMGLKDKNAGRTGPTRH